MKILSAGFWSRFLVLAVLSFVVACGSDDGVSSPNNTNNTNNANNANNLNNSDSDAADGGDINNDVDMGTDDLGPDMTEPSCMDECAPGSRSCDESGGYRVCGQFDSDPCFEFSPPVACPNEFVCELGQCVPPCRDECPVGSAICSNETTVSVCGNFDTDLCLEPGAPIECNAGERCEQGSCVDENDACTDECSAGETLCFGDSVRTCGDYDSDACLDLGPPVPCGLGEACSGGACVPFCQDECPADGVTECFGDAVRTCQATPNGCLEWTVTEACDPDSSCSDGACVDECVDECPVAGGAVCAPDGSGVSFCGEYDSDACLDRSSVVPCPQGFACQGGVCVATCTDECQVGAGARCGADGASIETCGNFDDDPCFEWGSNVSCPGGATCDQGACDVPCVDECVNAGQTQCTGDATQTCGQWDLDSCLEWSSPTACEAWEACANGTCELGQTPAAILINELLVDSVGGDTNTGNTLFVEIWGPAGTSLDGWQLVGVNGTGGSDYNPIDLTGEVIASDGYFVIAHPDGAQELLSQADLTHPNVDYQNGPDSVQLRWRGRVVDAVGYGSFSGSDVFAGEGTPVPRADPGHSLSRDTNHTDTDDNAADFAALASPTPREMAATCTDTCTPGETRCDGTQVQYCVTDADSDPCYEFGPSMDCPSAGETCSLNVCQPPCSDECPSAGATQCSGSDVQTCGNYDADACLEWSQPSACGGSETCVVDTCQDPTAPEVVLISPQGTLQTTQGNEHRMLVDVTPSAGRTVSTVRYFADGVEFATTTSAPHEAFFTVPTTTPTDSTISLRATAEDNAGIVGSSTYAYLNVKNDVPVADFTATITNTTTVTVDASASSDTESDSDDLEVCWDWNNNGTCDTSYSTAKVATHDFGASGTYTIRMVVRDEVGQTHSTTRQVSFADIQYIGGQNVSTTLWYGTIIVTGDITVPAGQTLTIAPGTDILFVFADVDSNGIGDYTLTVEGELIVNGTSAEPVVFSGQSAPAKIPGGWDRIVLEGSTPSSLSHTIIEYAELGLDIRNGSTLDNVEVRSTAHNCILLNNADGATMDNVHVHDCGANGVEIRSGSTSVSADNLTAESNGESGLLMKENSALNMVNSWLGSNTIHGFYIEDSTLDLADSTVEDNSGAGVVFAGNSDGLVTQNQIRNNGAEGVSFLKRVSGTPDPIINYNNIYSNALTGSAEATEHTLSLSASVTCCSSTGMASSTFDAPAGETIRRVYVNYDEAGTYPEINGYLETGSGSLIRRFTADFTGWVDLPDGITSVRVRVADSGRSYSTDTIAATQAETIGFTGSSDVVAVTNSNTINMKYNYLGTFPNVLNRVDLETPTSLDLQGFVGAAFDPSWDTTLYKAGDVGGESWSGTIVITGNVSVPAQSALSIAAGTVIEFVAHDQNLDSVGDWSITANGAMNVNGALGNEVEFKGYGGVQTDMYQTIELRGTGVDTSTWTDVILNHAEVGLTISGDSQFTRVEVNADSRHGVNISGSHAPVLNDFTIDGGFGDGIRIDGGSAEINRAMIRNHGRHGLNITGGSTAIIEDTTIRDNLGHGVRVSNASPELNYSLLTYNGQNGIFIEGSSNPSFTYSIVKFNDDTGVGIWNYEATSPTPTLNYNNIYANAVERSSIGEMTSISLSASVTCCSSSGVASSPWDAPADETIRRVYVNYDEAGTYPEINGYLETGSGTLLRRFTSDFTGWVAVPDGTTSVRVRVADSGRSYSTDTIQATQVETSKETPDAYELTCSTSSGTTDAKFNYWTPSIGDVPTKILETRAGSVDYTGFTGAEYPSGTVMQVGPRP